jgi:hypothetical protein
MASKIHFISHLEKTFVAANVGDWVCSPYTYYPDFFSRYTCVFHSHWNIVWQEIDRGDVVILGGGGQLDNSDELNEQINRVLRNCENVIIWGSGTHRYSRGNMFEMKQAELPIQYEKLKLVGVRDYQHPSGLPYLPCASCMHPAFTRVLNTPINVERKIGAIRSALEDSFAVSGTPSFMDNSQPLEKILRYVRESEIILVSSYHGAFWSQLCGRKVVLPESRLCVDKYKYFRHKPAFFAGSTYDEQQLTDLVAPFQIAGDFLAECQSLTNQFFDKVKALIQDVLEEPSPSEVQTLQILAKRNAQLEFSIVDMWDFIMKLNHRLSQIENSIN